MGIVAPVRFFTQFTSWDSYTYVLNRQLFVFGKCVMLPLNCTHLDKPSPCDYNSNFSQIEAVALCMQLVYWKSVHSAICLLFSFDVETSFAFLSIAVGCVTYHIVYLWGFLNWNKNHKQTIETSSVETYVIFHQSKSFLLLPNEVCDPIHKTCLVIICTTISFQNYGTMQAQVALNPDATINFHDIVGLHNLKFEK